MANVTLRIDDEAARTDQSGRFLLQSLTPGPHELLIDGRTANTGETTYGVFEVGVDITEGQTNTLPYTVWMPRIDTAHAVTIPSPTTTEVVVTTPVIPDLELRIPAGTVIRDHEGNVVREISITPIPLDRPPFPLPKNVEVPIYFTVQPGGAYLHGPQGASLVYPNLNKKRPGTRFNFWHYEPDGKGWYIYGMGTVSADGEQIVPDPGVTVYEFSGAMVAPPNFGPANGPPPGNNTSGGDPVDLSTGLFVSSKTDLFLPDVIPIALTRTYRPADTLSRPFGIGTTHSYELLIVGDTNPWTFAEIIVPDGGRIHYDRISTGTSFFDAVYEHVSTPTRFFKSRIAWNGDGWDLTLKDGTVYVFPDAELASVPGEAALVGFRDRHGNALTLERDFGNLTKITSPNGRSIEFTYDQSNRITVAKDNSGRMATYTYDAVGRLVTVTDLNSGVTDYTYDAFNRMLTLKDARGIVFLSNQYDASDRVIKQTQADGTTFQFAYTLDANGKVIQTDVTDPRGNLRRVTFNASGYTLSDTAALGAPEQQAISYVREPGTNLVLSVTDPLARKIAYTYDPMGNVTNITRLAGTPGALTTSFSYEPTFNQVASITDPLNLTTLFGYDSQGSLTSVTDPLGHQTTLSFNPAGQPLAVTDSLGHTTQFSYDAAGDLVTVTNPVGNTTTRSLDSLGRLLSLTDPLNHATQYAYDPLNRLKQVTDALGRVTAFAYDPNGNLLGVTDARGSATSYTYDSMDRLVNRTDPLGRSESYQYDAGGNLTRFTDRKGQATVFTYDVLNRRTKATYADGSTTTYTYDPGDRLTDVADSSAGAIALAYDGLDRLTQESTLQGTVDYTYDPAGRRTDMGVAGQSPVTYTYDNAHRLTQITQGASNVAVSYDASDRRVQLVLPNGIQTEYAYDPASRLTGITYKLGATVLGNLTYEYDPTGNRTKVGGSWARTGLPQAVASATYDAANEQLTFGGKAMTYDPNGNLESITEPSGTTSFTWDTRDRLVALSGPSVNASFGYDGLGRRSRKVINSVGTDFVYDGVNPVQEQSGGIASADLLTGLGVDEYFTRTDVAAATTSHFLPDGLGSAIALTDSAGAAQTSYTYEPFGNTTTTGPANSNPFQYTGRENDGTGLMYYRARYYQPGLQRFISEDPLGCGAPNLPPLKSIERNPQYLNLYAYVNNRVMNLNDPLGLCPDCSYYETRCQEVVGGFSKTYYCRIVPAVCNFFGCSPTEECIRDCLQDYDRNCRELPSGRKDPYGVAALCHELLGHGYCVPKCLLVDPIVGAILI